MGEIAYNDIHLSHMAQELRYGFYGDIDWAILEVCDIEEDGDIVKAYLTAAGGIRIFNTGIPNKKATVAPIVNVEIVCFFKSFIINVKEILWLS